MKSKPTWLGLGALRGRSNPLQDTRQPHSSMPRESVERRESLPVRTRLTKASPSAKAATRSINALTQLGDMRQRRAGEPLPENYRFATENLYDYGSKVLKTQYRKHAHGLGKVTEKVPTFVANAYRRANGHPGRDDKYGQWALRRLASALGEASLTNFVYDKTLTEQISATMQIAPMTEEQARDIVDHLVSLAVASGEVKDIRKDINLACDRLQNLNIKGVLSDTEYSIARSVLVPTEWGRSYKAVNNRDLPRMSDYAGIRNQDKRLARVALQSAGVSDEQLRTRLETARHLKFAAGMLDNVRHYLTPHQFDWASSTLQVVPADNAEIRLALDWFEHALQTAQVPQSAIDLMEQRQLGPRSLNQIRISKSRDSALQLAENIGTLLSPDELAAVKAMIRSDVCDAAARRGTYWLFTSAVQYSLNLDERRLNRIKDWVKTQQ